MRKIKLIVIKFFNLINFIINSILIKFIHLGKRKIKEKTLLIIRLDSIGDYVLVQNFFPFLKIHPLYKEYKITLCGNIIWKDLATHCNKNVFEDFIWIDKKKFKWNILYKFSILTRVYQSGFEIAVETTFSREILFGDTIIKTSKANQRIGSTGSTEDYVKWKRKFLTDEYYTKLITQRGDNTFEFYRNKEFFEKLLHQKIELNKPSIRIEEVEVELPIKKEFILIVPGAQEKARRWPEKNFSELINILLSRYDFDILLAGSTAEKSTTKRIVDSVNSERALDIAGKTTLPQLCRVISMAKLLISNDTSAVHFAASVNTPFICISNGKHFGRFNPYPEKMNIKCAYIYPGYIEKKVIDPAKLSVDLRFDKTLNINEISVKEVTEVLSDFFGKVINE